MVPLDSDRVSRVRPYSGANPVSLTFRLRAITLFRLTFQRVQLSFTDLLTGPTTPELETLVWAVPTSLAATMESHFDFSSTAY